jgi:hypothetical protein
MADAAVTSTPPKGYTALRFVVDVALIFLVLLILQYLIFCQPIAAYPVGTAAARAGLAHNLAPFEIRWPFKSSVEVQVSEDLVNSTYELLVGLPDGFVPHTAASDSALEVLEGDTWVGNWKTTDPEDDAITIDGYTMWTIRNPLARGGALSARRVMLYLNKSLQAGDLIYIGTHQPAV